MSKGSQYPTWDNYNKIVACPSCHTTFVVCCSTVVKNAQEHREHIDKYANKGPVFSGDTQTCQRCLEESGILEELYGNQRRS